MRDSDSIYDLSIVSDTEKDSLIMALRSQLDACQQHNVNPAWLENKVPLTSHDLRQFDEHWLCQLPLPQLQPVAIRLLSELRIARDRLNQNPENSSRPSSSRNPWESSSQCTPEPEPAPTIQAADGDDGQANLDGAELDISPEQPGDAPDARIAKPVKKKPGKQPGAPGFGRTQKLAITTIKEHFPEKCAACCASIVLDGAKAYSGWDDVDIIPLTEGQIGLSIQGTRHLLYETVCLCGHHTRAQHHVAPPDPLWENVEVGQWRLIGPRLAGAIVFLAMRMRLSRRRIQEILFELLGLQLSVGVIDEAIREAGRCCAPLENELVKAIEDAAILFVDETSWKEAGTALWLWTFVTQYTCLYCIGFRSMEILDNVLGSAFPGILMSDGYGAYRHFKNRLRCWAHLLRKLRGLAESTNGRVAGVGSSMLAIMELLMEAIYEARANPKPGGAGLASLYATEIARLKTLCENHQTDSHTKLAEVAREFLLDWTVILRQVDEPHLPLTNNAAEQALRHWVIARRINQGTRSEAGTRAYGLLASVIETCRARATSSWIYIASVIAAARMGAQVPQLPPIPVGG